MPINGSTFISQTTLFLRASLASGITDPISASRSGSESFIMTAYPERPIRYPIITIKPEDVVSSIPRLGFQVEDSYLTLPFEIRIWGRDQREKDRLSQEVYTWLRLNQFSGSYSTINENLFGFSLNSMVNVDEPGKGNPKSKILNISYNLVAI